jgi:hypothetical protein
LPFFSGVTAELEHGTASAPADRDVSVLAVFAGPPGVVNWITAPRPLVGCSEGEQGTVEPGSSGGHVLVSSMMVPPRMWRTTATAAEWLAGAAVVTGDAFGG